MKRAFVVFVLLSTMPFFGISQTMESINKATLEGLDEVAPFSEGLAAVRKGNQWGFIDQNGKLVIDFRDDLVWSKNANTKIKSVLGIRYPKFKDGRCLVQELREEGIAYYGFMDTKGEIVIKPEYLNVTSFDQGHAIGIFVRKTFRGQNEIKLNVFDYAFTEVLINPAGQIIWPISEREHLLTSKRRYEIPELRAKLISKELLAVKTKENRWQIKKLRL